MPHLDFVPYAARDWYPHMKPADIEIWHRFVQDHPDFLDHVAYDVPCGDGAAFDTTVNPESGGSASKLYKKKIDCVGMKGNALYVIEVKPTATAAAIGQVRAYAKLLVRDYNVQLPVLPVIITNALTPDMEYLAAAEHVELIVA